MNKIEIFENVDNFFPNKEKRDSLGHQIISEAFVYQYENNESYRKFCEAQGVTPKDVKEDLRKIPLLPSTLFKKYSIRTNTGSRTVRECYSSGTQGSLSTIERDEVTLENFFKSVQTTITGVFKCTEYTVLNLGPSEEQAKNVWFAYVMSSIRNLLPTKNYIKDGVFLCSDLVNDIKELTTQNTKLIIIGAPMLFVELFDFMDKNNITLELKEPITVTAGGWKKSMKKAVTKQIFNQMCIEHLKGLQEANIRDVFNMVELNTVLPECECGNKHIPVWLDIYAIDMKTYQAAEDGEIGLLGFVDSSAQSYPSFIMSGDLGRISHVDNCPCGKSGKCVEIVRRINTIESRGCALKIQGSVKEVQ